MKYPSRPMITLALLSLVIAPLVSAESQPLTLTPDRANDLTLATLDGGVYEVTTTGSDPYLYTDAVPDGLDIATNPILSFAYFSLTGTDEFQVFAVPPQQESVTVRASGLSRSEGWSSHRIDLTPLLEKLTAPVTQLRIDFGRKAGKSAQIREVQLRPLNETEKRLARDEADRKAREAALDKTTRTYLDTPYPATMERVEVEHENVRVTVNPRGAARRVVLVEIPVWGEATNPNDWILHDAIRDGNSDLHEQVIPRFDEQGRDRLYSRWAVARENEIGLTLLSHGRYADAVTHREGLTEAPLRNRKGLGAFSPGRPVEDVKDLGVSAVTVNIILQHFMRAEGGEGRTAFEYGGRTWYTDNGAVAHMDATMQLAATYDVVVSAIVLLGQAGDAPEGSFSRLVAHPDADPAGIYVMPNFTHAEGVNAYAAALNFLAERYSRPDGEFGRIHHWIVHNEVNSGWVWTNMGEKSALRYMDAYHKSMRMTQLIAWQYDPHAKVYISLEHHWDSVYADHCYKGKELLDLLLSFSRAEGDFPWAIAYHPYPENLREPRAWEDDTAWFSFDTPRITFKNMEVINAWVKKPETRYLGKHVRDVQFTEQAPNSPDYSEESLRDQAACMAYLWKKLEALDSVSMFHVHNWVDNRHEGGLRIGLRRFPDDEEDPHGKKPVWYVFQALGTDKEAEATEFAKAVIGIEDWSEVVYTGEIPETRGE